MTANAKNSSIVSIVVAWLLVGRSARVGRVQHAPEFHEAVSVPICADDDASIEINVGACSANDGRLR